MDTAVAQVTAATEEPHRRLGKRAQVGVPHKGWQSVFVTDLGAPDHTCEMCESQQVRYVHHMQHSDYPDILEVGCVCAGKMEGSLENARRREKTLKDRHQKRAKWLNQKWAVSDKGNPWLKIEGYRVIVHPKGPGWTFMVIRNADEAQYRHAATLPTPDEAKLASFDFLSAACNDGVVRPHE